ncbi:MAG TPA: hypothetical protein VMG12_42120 [Polyangiaceae bacterium]|nr:hypothetical protein [Polyangiaceae bacterium]
MHRGGEGARRAWPFGPCSALVSACAGLLFACGDAVSFDPGVDAALRVEGATFFRDGLPASGGGPAVLGAFLTQTTFRAGEQDKSFGGVVDLDATGVAIALDGQRGYWVVPTGMPLPETPMAASFDAPLSFSLDVAPGRHTLRVWASDLSGAFGDPVRVDFSLVPRALPEGRLVVALTWDTQSDLDLHVVLPDAVEVYSGNINSWQRSPGVPSTPDAWRSGGLLDFDSNADCHIDGRRNENVVWTETPASGSYLVRVDAPSLCGAPAARWRVDVLLDGESLAAATGNSFADAGRFSHGRGAGAFALGFDVP